MARCAVSSVQVHASEESLVVPQEQETQVTLVGVTAARDRRPNGGNSASVTSK